MGSDRWRMECRECHSEENTSRELDSRNGRLSFDGVSVDPSYDQSYFMAVINLELGEGLNIYSLEHCQLLSINRRRQMLSWKLTSFIRVFARQRTAFAPAPHSTARNWRRSKKPPTSSAAR